MTNINNLGLNSPLDDTLSDSESDDSISLESLNLVSSIFPSKDIFKFSYVLFGVG
jgi:hypothetical protein